MEFGNKSKFILGNSEVVLGDLPSDSIDLIVTDPPYGKNIMGKDWDKTFPKIEILEECLKVLKPGGFGFFMASNRQDLYSKMVERLERVGFVVEFPSLFWAYANSVVTWRNIEEDVANKMGCEVKALRGFCRGFRPKPAVEIILSVMKPLSERTFTLQALYNGKGVSNVDACRIPYPDQNDAKGREPSTLLVSDKVLDYNDRTFSENFDLDAWFWSQMNISELPPEVWNRLPFLDVPKAYKKEKEAGLDHLPAKEITVGQKKVFRKNTHPTVKPIKLMSYLITLGSREGNLILDPFAGSGTTCIAAGLFKRDFIGIEINPEYYDIAVEKIKKLIK